MQTISLCMIVKNEESHINDCLKSSYNLLDEIIIVDTGSTDKTKEICKRYTDKIYDYPWDYDFGKARNYSFSLATSNYILWLDSDDIILPENYLKLQKLKASLDGSIDIYNFWYDYRHNEKGDCIYTFYRERLIKNTPDIYWDCIVHELLHYKKDSLVANTDIRVTHTSNHDNSRKYIGFFEKKINSNYTLNPREKYFYAIELIKNNNIAKAVPYLDDFINDSSYDYGYNNSYEISCAYELLAQYYELKGDYQAALHCYYRQIYYHQPSAESYYNLANCYLNLGNYNSSIFYLKTIVEIDFPKDNFLNGSQFGNLDYFYKTRSYRIKALLMLVSIYYYHLNDNNTSKFYNDKLLLLDPQNESAIFNKNFFDNLK